MIRSLIDLVQTRLPTGDGRILAAGSALALVLRVTGVVGTLVLNLLLTRWLGLERFGDYVYTLSWISVIGMGAALGLDTSALRFVATYRAAGESGLLHGFVRRSLAWTTIASCAMSLAMVAVVYALGERVPGALADTFRASALLLPAFGLLLVASSLLRGFKRLVLSMGPQWVLRPVLIAGGFFVCLSLVAHELTAAEVMLVDAGATVVTLVVVVAALHRQLLSAGILESAPRHRSREWAATSWPILVQTGIRFAMNRTDILLAGVFLGTELAGIYVVSSQMASLLAFGLLAVNMIAAPLFAEVHAQRRREDLQRLVRLGTRAVFVFAISVGGGLLALGPLLLGVYGEAFLAAGYAPLAVLVLSQVINSVAGSVGYLMTMTGHEREAARVTGACGVLNLALGLILIPNLGLVGAALSTLVTNVVWNGILVWKVRRRLEIDATILGRPPGPSPRTR